jgi:hypothetical protein
VRKKIKFKAPDKDSYDGKRGSFLIQDEAGIWPSRTEISRAKSRQGSLYQKILINELLFANPKKRTRMLVPDYFLKTTIKAIKQSKTPPTMNKDFTEKDMLDFAAEVLDKRVKFAVLNDYAAAPVPIQAELSKFKKLRELEKEQQHQRDIQMQCKSIPEKDWEIVAYRDPNCCTDIKNADIIYKSPFFNMFNYAALKEYPIHSVKRLKDGEVFSADDLTTYGRIKRFYKTTNDTVMCVEFTNGSGATLRSLEKVKEKPLLFTTEDGKEIIQDSEELLWRVFTEPSSFVQWKPYLMGIPKYTNKGEKYFSTKEAAEEYVNLFKPQLSINDLKPLLNEIFYNVDEAIESRIKPLIKK